MKRLLLIAITVVMLGSAWAGDVEDWKKGVRLELNPRLGLLLFNT